MTRGRAAPHSWKYLGSVILALLAATPECLFGQCPDAGDSSANARNKGLYCRFIGSVYNQGTLDSIEALVDPGFSMNGLAVSTERLRAAIDSLRQAFPDLHIDIQELLGEGNAVAAHVVIRGTLKKSYRKINRPGKSIQISTVVLWVVKDGKLSERWSGPDDLELIRQLQTP